MLRRLVLATCISLAAQVSAAADWKPLVVASLSSWKELQGDLGFLGQLIQNPDLADRLVTSLFGDARPQGLSGLDPDRPWGAMLRTDGLRIVPMVFVPISDLPKLLESLTPFIGMPQQASPGVWKIGQRTLTGFVREHNGWAYMAQTADVLEHDLPDPAVVMGELPGKYEVAVNFYPTNLPEALRTMAIDDARERKQMLSGVKPDTASLLFSATLSALPYTWVEETLTDVQQLTVGWRLDRQQKLTRLDLSIIPLAGSPTSRRWGARAGSSRFTINGPAGAPSLGVLLTEFPSGPIFGIRSSVNGAPRATVPEIQRLFEALLDEAAAADRRDTVLRVLGKSPPFVVVAAAHVRSAAAIEQRIIELAAIDPDTSGVRVKLNAARISEANIHVIEPVATSSQDWLRRLLGNDLAVYWLIGKSHVSVACGPRALAALEEALPGEEARPAAFVELTARLGAALSAYARTTSQKDIVPWLSLVALSLQAGDDRVSFTADADAKGLNARLECREAALRAAALGLSLLNRRVKAEEPTRPARTP